MQQSTNTQATEQSNKFYNSASIVDKRLNTETLLFEMYKFLSGVSMEYEADDRGNIKKVMKQFGTAVANQVGIQKIMSHLNSIINSSGVQGNFDRMQYDLYVKHAHRRLAKLLVVHSTEWGINTANVGDICGVFSNLIRAFMTRPIDNKERESYQDTFKVTESNTLKDKGFEFFKQGA
jgi:hypothetical protein